MQTPHYLKKILTARVYDVAIESPLESARILSARMGNKILLKREDLQPVFSFKLRGAYNKMAQLGADELGRGVITASAGNHAQGVALAARTLGCRAVIVMPVTTPQLKVEAVAARGGEIVLHGESYSDAWQHSQQLQEREGLSYVHAFDDPDVIAGQGTIGMEILRQHQGPIDAIFVPIGGGGLIAGIATYVKQIRPEIRVIGVQTIDSDAMARSVHAGRRIELADVGLFSDGTAVKQVGYETFRLVSEYVDEILTVNTDAVCAAIKDVFTDTRSIPEAAGALAVAGMKAWIAREGARDRSLVPVVSGANMQFDRLRFVSERAEIGEQREAVFAVTIPEQRGSLRRFCELLGSRNITEFNYRIADASSAHIFVGIQVRTRAEAIQLAADLEQAGFGIMDLTDDELAKSHLRYTVGGRSPLAQDERVLRFEFPERPGALMRFLERMRPEWNISLFHYRNHGDDSGRVLVGMQVPRHTRGEFREFLDTMGYRYWDESDHPAYRLFLGRKA